MASAGGPNGAQAAHPSHAWVPRTRALDAVDGARVVLVEAPGGWGKTTLAGQALDRWGAAPCWVRLQGHTSVDDAVSLLARGLRRSGIPDLADVVADASSSTDAGDAFLGALARRSEPLTLVVDDAQRLDDDAARWVRSVLDDVPAPHRAVVIGRDLPRPIARRVPAAWVRIGADDLRFGRDEVSAVLGGADDVRVTDVLDRTGGWPTAVGLVAQGHEVAPGGTDTAVMDRLLDEVLGDDRDTVAPAALLPRLSAEVCAAVAGPDAFSRLRSSGLPMTQVGEWWVLADPVREVLGRGLELDDAMAAMVARAYDMSTAVGFLGELGHLEAVTAELGRRRWQELEEMGAAQLAAVVDRIGVARITPQAALHVARAIELRDAQRRRDLIAVGLERADGDAEVRHALEAEAIREMCRRAEVDDAIAASTDLLARLGPDEHAARGRTLLALGIAHAFRSTPEDLAQADDALGRAAELFRLLGERAWEADALNRLAIMVSYHGGRIELAAEQEAASLALLVPGSRAWAVNLTYYTEILIDLGRVAEGEAAALRAIEVGRRIGDATLISYGAWAMAVVCCARGDLEATRQWLDEVERTPGTWLQEVSGQEFLSFGADLLGALGDRDGAMVYRDRCAARVGHGGTQSVVDVVDGRLDAMYGDPQRAIEIFERLDGEPYATIRAKWVRLLFRALAAKRLGERTEATVFIERSLALVEQMGVPDLPQRKESVVVQMLADVWPGGADRSTTAQLRIVMLGSFVVLNGVEVVTPAPGHPATLVKVLALRRSLTVDQAIDLLWPDADVATGRQRLRNLLNRLRGQTGDVVVRHGDALRLVDGVTTDVDQFEAGVDAAFAASASDRAGLARLALGGYPGDLLPADIYEEWSAGARERLRRRYLSLVDIVAAEALDRGDLDEGVRLLDLAIEREPLEEHRYVTVARALQALGRRSAAREVVLRAAAALDDLGVAPGRDLAEVGRSLDVDTSQWRP